MSQTFVSAPVAPAAVAVVAVVAAAAAAAAGTQAPATEATTATATAAATEGVARPQEGHLLRTTEEDAPDVTTDQDRDLTLLVSISSVHIKAE